MANKVNPVPAGYHTVTPYITIKGVAGLLDFLEKAFGAKVKERMQRPDGSIGHAEVLIGDSMLMMGEPQDPSMVRPASLYLYLEDVDAAYRRALEAGAISISEPADMFYGDRGAGVRDGFGNIWWIGTHIEDVSPEEIERRMKAQKR